MKTCSRITEYVFGVVVNNDGTGGVLDNNKIGLYYMMQ